MKKLIGLKGGQDSNFFEIIDSQRVEDIVRYPSIKDGIEINYPLCGTEAEHQEYMDNKQKITYIGYRLTVTGNPISAESVLMDMGYRAVAINPNTIEILLEQSHGGPRPGAGAPKQAPPDATRRTFLLTDDEHIKVREFIQQLRAAE